MLNHFSRVWLCDPNDYSMPGSSVHVILQATILEWVAMPFSRGFSWPRNLTHISSISRLAGRFSITSAPEFSHVRLQPQWLQHARPLCPSPTPRVYSNSCPLSQWCHPTISSSVVPFSSRLQSFPALGYFPMSHFFTSGGQSVVVSASTSVLPINIQDWFPLGWTGWISLQSKGLSRVFSNTTVQKHQFLSAQLSLFIVQLSHLYVTTGKTIALTRCTFVDKVMSLLFNMLSRLVITFPRSKCLLISWLQSPSVAILEPKK